MNCEPVFSLRFPSRIQAVDEVEGSALASELNMLFYEASAKTNHNVDVVFRKVRL
jgi:hypothetical protein